MLSCHAADRQFSMSIHIDNEESVFCKNPLTYRTHPHWTAGPRHVGQHAARARSGGRRKTHWSARDRAIGAPALTVA